MRRRTFLAERLRRMRVDAVSDTAEAEAREARIYETLCRAYPPRDAFHVKAHAIIASALPRAVQFILLGQNGPAYLELHAALEREAAWAVGHAVGHDSRTRIIAWNLLSRKNASELARLLRDLGRWDDGDVRYVDWLSRLRNAIAHANEEGLSKILEPDSTASIDRHADRANRRDATQDLVKTVVLMLKATSFRRKGRKRVGHSSHA